MSIRKLKLNLDALRVQAFETMPAPPPEADGTVHGYNSGRAGDPRCASLCPDCVHTGSIENTEITNPPGC
jgi:hypothetical protein